MGHIGIDLSGCVPFWSGTVSNLIDTLNATLYSCFMLILISIVLRSVRDMNYYYYRDCKTVSVIDNTIRYLNISLRSRYF